MEKNSQSISRKDLKIIYKEGGVCEGWKTKIKDALFEQDGVKIDVANSILTQAHKEANPKQKKLLEKYFKIESPLNIIKEINGFDDILRLSKQSLSDILPYTNPKNKKQRSQNALAKIQLITEVYNKDQDKLDWKNSNQYKHIPYFIKNTLGVWCFYRSYDYFDSASGGAGCYFAIKEYSEDAAKKFIDIYREYLPE